MQISFERQILEGLGNTDMLSAYVRAAVADRGDGVKVNGALWPHLTPPAKVGGVARALVKMGLLVPSGAGVYQVVTGTTGPERLVSDEQATSQRRASEVPAFATQLLQGMGSDASEAVANQERQESDVEAMRQREEGGGPESEDIIALEELMDDLAERTQSQAKGISLGFRRPEPIAQEIPPDVEERARELALRSWEGMPDPVRARVGHDFEEFWKTSAGRFRREAAS